MLKMNIDEERAKATERKIVLDKLYTRAWSQKLLRVAWLNEHLFYWSGGVKWILEVSKRLQHMCKLDIFVEMASIENRQLFRQAGIELQEFSSISTNNKIYWLLYPYFILENYFKLRHLLKSYDIIISTSPTTCIIAAMLNKKSIFMFFEPNVWLYSPTYISGLPLLQRLILKIGHLPAKWLDQAAMRKADRLVTLDNLNAERGRTIYNRDINIIPIGVDTELFSNKHDLELEKCYIGKQVIIHSATYLSPVKGTQFIIKAMPKIIKHVPNCHLLILNPHEQVKERAEFMALTESIGIASHVEFLPKLKEEELPYYFSLAKVVIQPSLYVSMHMPIAEGAACETPAIAFDGINADEDIVNGITGYITPTENIDILAQKTIELLQNDNLRVKMGKRARERVVKLFSWEHNAELMFNMAKEIYTSD